jgi:predicted anti-sigma-YlaC factor YlaD
LAQSHLDAVCAWLHAIKFSDTFKGGVKKTIAAKGVTLPLQAAVLRANDTAVERCVGAALAPHISEGDARVLATFWSSPTGQWINAQQMAQIPLRTAYVQLTPPGAAAFDKFAATAASRKEVLVMHDHQVVLEYLAALENCFGKRP